MNKPRDWILKKLSSDLIKINHGARIQMNLFLSFLDVSVKRSQGNWIGKSNGWTQLEGDDLIIGGGVCNRIEYLDSIQYMHRLDNKYNDFVNPLYLWDVMNNSGKEYFLNFYSKDIIKLYKQSSRDIETFEAKYNDAISRRNDFTSMLGFIEL